METQELVYSWLDDGARERFWAKVNHDGPLPDFSDPLVTAPATPCWEWTAAKNTTGYGAFTPSARGVGKTSMAHRIVYMECRGPIIRGNHIDHLCRNRGCVNPDHLESVTHRENLLRGDTVVRKRSLVTHCPKGHEYDTENTSVSSRNQRGCRTCHREFEQFKRDNDSAYREMRRRYMKSYNARKRQERLKSAGALIIPTP